MSQERIAQIQANLETLAASRERLAALDASTQEVIEASLPAAVKADLATYKEQRVLAVAQLAALEEDIKDAVLALGESVKSDRMQAVWNKARETWDSKNLDGYAAARPEILAFKKVGEPSVSFRTV